MLASRLDVWPNSGRPFVSLAAVMLPLGVVKFAVLNTLNNCAMNSTWCDLAIVNVFEKRRSRFENPGQSTFVTGVNPRDVRTALIASRLSARQPVIGSTPAGKSPVYPSPLRSPSELDGLNGR